MTVPPSASRLAESRADLDKAVVELQRVQADLEQRRKDLYEDPPWIGAVIAAVATVVDVVHRVAGNVAQYAEVLQIVAAILFHSKELRGVFERLNPAVANFLGEHLGNLAETLARGSDGILNDIAQQTLAGHDVVADATELASLKRAAADIATRAVHVRANVDAHAGIMGQLAEKGEQVLRELVEGLLNLYTSELQGRRDELPENVNNIAAGMVSKALKFGLGAQVAALVVEALYATKYTGLNQLVGYVADFAGFSKVTGPIIDPQLKWGLAIPAEHQAAKLFRTRLPGGRDVREQAWQRHVTPEDYARALRLEGFPEDWIAVLVADLYPDPRPREIMQLTEGLDVDPAWLTDKYREHGWDDRDVARAVETTMRRSRQPAADRYARTVATSYLNGYRTIDQARSAATNLSRDQAYLELWTYALKEERNHRTAEQLATAVLKQAHDDVIGSELAEEMLESLGFTEPERRRRIALTQLERNLVLVKKDTAEIEQQMRTLRAQALTALRGELRKGAIEFQEFVTLGRMVGYDEQWLGAIGDLEATRAPARTVTSLATVGLEKLAAEISAIGEIPTDEKGKPLPGYEQLQSAGLANLRAHLRAGVLSREDFIALGQLLGFAELTLEQMADVDLLRVKPSAEILESDDATVLAESAHAALLDLTADLVARQVIAGARAIQLLHDAGVPVTVAQVVIGIAEILGRRTHAAVSWPFESNDPRKLVWTSVLEAILDVVRGGFGGRGLLGELLSLVGGGPKSDGELRGVLDGLTSLFHHRQPRSREHVNVERTARPPGIPSPPDETQGPTPEEKLRAELLTDVTETRLMLLDCQATQAEQGKPVEATPEFIPAIDETTSTADLFTALEHYGEMLERCQRSIGAPIQPPPAPPGGFPPPQGPAE